MCDRSVLLSWTHLTLQHWTLVLNTEHTLNTLQVLSSLYSVSIKSCCRKCVRDLWWPNDWPFESPLVISCTLSLKWAEVPWLQKYLSYSVFSIFVQSRGHSCIFPYLIMIDWWGHIFDLTSLFRCKIPDSWTVGTYNPIHYTKFQTYRR